MNSKQDRLKASLTQNQTNVKTEDRKEAGDTPKLVEWRPSMHEVLCFILNTAKVQSGSHL